MLALRYSAVFIIYLGWSSFVVRFIAGDGFLAGCCDFPLSNQKRAPMGEVIVSLYSSLSWNLSSLGCAVP